MASKYNNELLELLETRQLIIVENGSNFTFTTKKEETEYIKKVNYDLQKHYTHEGLDHIIINLDYDTIKPFARYCLKDVYKSLEYKAIVFNRFLLFLLLFFLLMLIFMCFGVKSGINNVYEVLAGETKIVKKVDPKFKYDAQPSINIDDIGKNKNNIEFDLAPVEKTDNRGSGDFNYKG